MKEIIEALYRASQAGVQIELVVRGACALRPGLRGISSRIRVRSVIGRFLEHSRVFVFGNGGKTETYLGSADWMHRNIYERVEVMFHLRDPELARQIFARSDPAVSSRYGEDAVSFARWTNTSALVKRRSCCTCGTVSLSTRKSF